MPIIAYLSLLLLLCPVQGNTAPPDSVLQLDYPGFTIWLDCYKRAAVKFQYLAQRDSGDYSRYSRFFLDPTVPLDCQQKTSKAYGMGYQRGHQVPANHLDGSAEAIKASNTMTNILPQTADLNLGAWLQTEEIIECYRDLEELLVIGGALWDEHTDNDYFVESHGLRTPAAFWKVVIRGGGPDEQVIAWLIPNTSDVQRNCLNQYLISVIDLERITGESLPVAEHLKTGQLDASWIIPKDCNKKKRLLLLE
jgi:endonuclease G